MAQTMFAVRKVQPGPGLEVVEVAVPRIAEHEVLVRVEAASICGTDLHIWRWDRWSQRRIKPPLTLGHEFAGTIVEVGSLVQHAAVGEFVSAESHVTCGMCYQCRTGQAHMCPKTQILGVDRDGAFAEYIAVPEEVIWHNDRRKFSPEIASLQEPFGNAVFATLDQDVTGRSVAILGCGPIGLFSIGIAKASGAARVLATDVNKYRLDLARKMGADDVFDPSTPDDGGGRGGVVARLVEANGGLGVDIVQEMSGAPAAITTAFKAVRNGGCVVLFGIPSDPVEIDVAENMIFKNLTVKAINGRRIFGTWYKTQWLLGDGKVDLRPLVTRKIAMPEINDAMKLLASGRACKIVLEPEHAEARDLPAAPTERAVDPDIEGQVTHR